MEQREGKVSKIFSNNYQGKTLYSLRLEGDETYYGAGTKSLGMIKAGQTIRFNVERNGNRWNLDTDSIEILKTEAPTQPSSSARPWKGGKSAEEKDYWSRKEARDVITQERIQYQAARNAANDTARILLDNGAVPDFKENTKAGAKFDVIMALIDELTARYHKAASNVSESIKTSTIEHSQEEEQEDDPFQ